MRSWLSAVRMLSALAVVCLVFGGCVSRPADRELLSAKLGRDPVELLRVLGSGDVPAELHSDLRTDHEPVDLLRLVRFGLAHEDEHAVFGAVLLMGDQLAVPEMQNAAAVVLPRLAHPDCPLTPDDVKPLVGSVDFEALMRVIPVLPEEIAERFLNELHRMVRPDALPALCELLLTTEGRVRHAVLADACMTATYSQQGVPELLAATLKLIGRSPTERRDGLSGVLHAALQAHLEVPEYEFPVVCVARWLLASEPATDDLPVLRGLLASPHGELRNAAAWAIGGMSDAASGRLLTWDRPDKVVSPCWLAARARRGDAQALETLFAGEGVHFTYALAAASPERRRKFFAHLLALPAEQAVPIVRDLGLWPRGELFESIADPPYDDALLADLEPMVAVAPELDPRILRALVASLPCCETTRLADALLAHPADAMFAAQIGRAHRVYNLGRPYLGHGGEWAFLEVTRPVAFRNRLREGLGSDVAPVRAQCADLLVRIGDTERLAELAEWLDGREFDWTLPGWLLLARDGSREVREMLRERVVRSDARDEDLVALAVTLGLPYEYARHWRIPSDHKEAVRVALLAGDAVAALLASHHELSGWSAPLLTDWRQPRVTAALRTQRLAAESMEEAFRFDQALALVAGDRAQLEHLLEPVRAGRYATHHGLSAAFVARVDGLANLPFWIDQLGSNCCKCTFVDEVLEVLFRLDSNAFDRCTRNEPASVYLRRTLLPVADRLRSSRIAGGYVVAGR